MARPEANLAFALAEGHGRGTAARFPLLAAAASPLHALNYHAPLGGYRCESAKRVQPVQITEVCLRVKVYGGLYHGRVLVLPEGTREGDLVDLPVTLPAGEMYGPGRTHPELHINSRVYKVAEIVEDGKQYLASVPLRFVGSVDVPSPATIPITVHLR